MHSWQVSGNLPHLPSRTLANQYLIALRNSLGVSIKCMSSI